MKTKITTGAVFMYRKGGIPATCFSFTMKQPVQADVLQAAAQAALTRYPYFCVQAVEENGDYYLVDNPLPFCLIKEGTPLCSKESNGYLLGVCAQGDKIIFSVHHGLSDGGGFLPFIRTVLTCYCTAICGHSLSVPDVRLRGTAPAPEETIDPASLPLPSGLQKAEAPAPFALPEASGQYDAHYRWRIDFDAEELYAFAHPYAAGLSAVISLFMCEALQAMYPQADNITAHVASDAREALGAQHTYMNCLDNIALPYSHRIQKMNLEMKLTAFAGITQVEKQPQKVLPRFAQQGQLAGYLAKYPIVQARQQMMDFTNRLTISTFLVSYVGRMNLGEAEESITRAEVYGSGTNGLLMEVMSVGKTVTVSLMQNFETAAYVQQFVKVCQAHGLHPSVTYIGAFETPRCPIA